MQPMARSDGRLGTQRCWELDTTIPMGPFRLGLPYDSMLPLSPVSSPFISSHLNLRPRALPLLVGRLRNPTDHTEHCRLMQEITIQLKAGKQNPTAWCSNA